MVGEGDQDPYAPSFLSIAKRIYHRVDRRTKKCKTAIFDLLMYYYDYINRTCTLIRAGGISIQKVQDLGHNTA